MDSINSARAVRDSILRFAGSAWEGLNAFVKTPVFVFLVGGSFAAWYPAIRNATTPASERAAQKAEQEARADAALIAPILANLDIKDKGKYQASRAILRKLAGDTSGGKRPVIVAAIQALEDVGAQVYPNQTSTAPVDTTDKGAQRVYEAPTAKAASDSTATPRFRPAVALVTPLKDSGISSRVLAPAPLPEDPALVRLRSAAIYIQANQSDGNRITLAESLRHQLVDAKILALAVQRMDSSKIPRYTQVRYYHEEDRAMAEDLAELASTWGHLRVVLKKPTGWNASQGILELWLGKS